MKRLLIAAGVAGLSLSAVVAQADHFRIRYRVQYSGGAYLGYPSTTTYSVNYYPMNVPGPAGTVQQTTDANGQPVYPRFIGPGYTVTGQPGPYTSYGYNFKQSYQYGDYQHPNYGNGGSRSGCSTCNQGTTGSACGNGACGGTGEVGSVATGGQPVVIKNRLRSGGQTSRYTYPSAPAGPSYESAPIEVAPEAAPTPVAPKAEGVTVPPPASPKAEVTPVVPKPVTPKTARGNTQGSPVLVADEQEVGS